MLENKNFENSIKKIITAFTNECPSKWRERTNYIKHLIGEEGIRNGLKSYYKIEHDCTGKFPVRNSEYPYYTDISWADEPIDDFYEHSQKQKTFKEYYQGYKGLILAAECEWAIYNVKDDLDLRLRSMVKDFRKLTWFNAVYKLFIYSAIYDEEKGVNGLLLNFLMEKILCYPNLSENGNYYFVEFRPNDLTRISFYKYQHNSFEKIFEA
ncbi:MAG: hypothetical protein HQK79_19925 [Desulfobacterales bacterium]|nr:hypothetical protein [Desulfobacterales bacterium]